MSSIEQPASRDIVVATSRVDDLNVERSHRKRIGLIRALLGLSTVASGLMAYYFVANPREDFNWFGSLVCVGIGYVLWQSFNEFEEYENFINHKINRIESFKSHEELREMTSNR